MARQAATPFDAVVRYERPVVSFLTSLVVHAALVVLLGLVWFAAPPEREALVAERGREGYFRAWEQIQTRSGQWVNAAGSCAQRGDPDAAFAHLETAFARRDPLMRRLTIFPWLAPLHSDPRFAELARRMKLPLPKP